MTRNFMAGIVLALCCSAGAYAEDNPDNTQKVEVTAEDCFKKAPADVLPLIAPSTRLDMIDYFSAGMDTKSDNSISGKCYITALSPESISFVAGTDVEYQMFVVQSQGGTPIIGVIQTINTPVPDSTLRLYLSNWSPLASDKANALNVEPTLAQWLKSSDKGERADVEEAVPFVLASYEFDPNTSSVMVRNNMDKYYMPADTPAALAAMRSEITYKWSPKDHSFLMVK